MTNSTVVRWEHGHAQHTAAWPYWLHQRAPQRIVVVNDTVTADQAFRHITQGTALLWQGDYHNARQLLAALARRVDKLQTMPTQAPTTAQERKQRFNRHRQQQSQRATLLNKLLVPMHTDGSVLLRRAPDTIQACQAVANPPATSPFLLPLRALLGLIGSWQWQRTGINVPGLARPLHVHYGVFSPLRGEYLDLLWKAPLQQKELAWDIGTGSGVIAAILATRGVKHIVATDVDTGALNCARQNLDHLGLSQQVELKQTNRFPLGQSPLIVCNPPWLPARPTTPLEHALYDPDHQMLTQFLEGVCQHLTPDGQAWLIMSDLAEHLGLRDPGFIENLAMRNQLQVIQRFTAQPTHSKAQRSTDPLAFARTKETTSLWCFRKAPH